MLQQKPDDRQQQEATALNYVLFQHQGICQYLIYV
jgi:hypothetical protein